MTFLRIVIPLYLFCAHDLFGKPVATFPDHALARHSRARASANPEFRICKFWIPDPREDACRAMTRITA
jgi:hypothetical protein